MNNVQTNLMSIAPAPSTQAKANAADAVRPVKQAGAAAERGAKNPSFDKALAKLKSMKQGTAGKADVAGNDSLAASLAASQQAASDKTAPEADEASAKAEKAVQTVEKSAAVGGANAEAKAMQTAAADVEASVLQAAQNTPTSLAGAQLRPQVTVSEVMPAAAGEAVVPTGEPEQATAYPLQTVPVQEEAAKDAAILAGTQPGINAKAEATAPQQSNALKVGNIAALLAQNEAPQAPDLLQALASRTLPQPQTLKPTADAVQQTVQVNLMADAVQQMAQANPTAGDADGVLPDALLRTLVQEQASAVPTAPQQAQANPTANAAAGVLPAALLRTLAQEPAASAASQQAQPAGQQDAPPPQTLDVKILPQQPSDAAHGQDLADSSADDGFASLFGQQGSKEQKTADEVQQPLAEGTARTKMASAMPFFAEAAKPQESRELHPAAQANPAVSFQATLDEAASAQPAAPTMPQKDYEVARQIVEQARLLRLPEQTEMVIRLKPEHLGELTLKVSVAASGAVNAAFHTDNAAVRAISETSMIQLKHELQAQGLKVDNVGVYAGLSDSSLMNGQQDANAYYAQQGGQGSSQGRDAQQALASFEEEQQALAAAEGGQGVLAQDGVDYRI